MRVRLLLGPAGSGKTTVCLGQVKQALNASSEGRPLVFLAPRQSTYQIERQLLEDPRVRGFSRLHILSFERLARFIFDELGQSPPNLLDDSGRLMVIRGLLARLRDKLRLFRASARLTGFAQEVSNTLSELERYQLGPESLTQLAGQIGQSTALGSKLEDLATLMREYAAWLNAHQLQDADRLLSAATGVLKQAASEGGGLALEQLWVDGFGDWCPQELELLLAVIGCSKASTITFCLDPETDTASSWLSSRSVTRAAYEACLHRLQDDYGADVAIEWIPRARTCGRFSGSPELFHLERSWSEPEPFQSPPEKGGTDGSNSKAVRLLRCPSPEAEVTVAAREILRHVREGGRFRETAVLMRTFDPFHEPLQRVFSRYCVPFFLDRRESVSHHPLAELTRGALRTVCFGWQWSDWFGALKTGLATASDAEIDRLENEALARGWQGETWHGPIVVPDDPELTDFVSRMQKRLMPPFQKLLRSLASTQNRPSGRDLAVSLRDLWADLKVEDALVEWGSTGSTGSQSSGVAASAVHAAVWQQMNDWLANVELAFAEESLPLRQWLPILESGLSGLSVGLIPPALDQVVVGSVDRSRNPEASLVIVLGLNEGIFPALPTPEVLLTDSDRSLLEGRGVRLGADSRQQILRERFYAYIAFTRARDRLVLTRSMSNSEGGLLGPSGFLSSFSLLFPGLEEETADLPQSWEDCEHPAELMPRLLKLQGFMSFARDAGEGAVPLIPQPAVELLDHPTIAPRMSELRQFKRPAVDETIPAELVRRLYGPVLSTSVSRLEQFAACPFKFFVHSGLRAEERLRFEVDVKEQGSFQHDVLACFHQQLQKANLAWRQITPAEARERVARIATEMTRTYRDGLLNTSEESRFLARVLTCSLEDFIEVLVGWIREQYQFDPAQVELGFGEAGGPAGWSVDLDAGCRLRLRGRIDRIDLCRSGEGDEALCVVIDYKSGQRKLDPLLIENGMQLQLLAYLMVLWRWQDAKALFNVSRLVPAGVFYVNLRGKYAREQNRTRALETPAMAKKSAYQHSGRFDWSVLPYLDSRADVYEGDQFNYRLTKARELHKACSEAVAPTEFLALLEGVESTITKMGQAIFAGRMEVSPYRKGSQTACDQCVYQSICRIDPWTHPFRVLRRSGATTIHPGGGEPPPIQASGE